MFYLFQIQSSHISETEKATTANPWGTLQKRIFQRKSKSKKNAHKSDLN